MYGYRFYVELQVIIGFLIVLLYLHKKQTKKIFL